MPSILIFFLILSSLVIIHELGHFWAAKKVGVKVLEFGLGLPPRLFGKKFKGTIYSFNLLPLGGFVHLKGEDEAKSEDKETSQDLEDGTFKNKKVKASDSFADKNPYERAFIIIAGVVMNLIVAVVLFQGVLMYSNYKSNYIPLFMEYTPLIGQLEVKPTMITAVSGNSKLDPSTFNSADYVYSINGTEVNSFQQLREFVNTSQTNQVNVVIKNLRDPSFVREIEVELFEKEGQKYLGFQLMKAGRISYSGGLEAFAGIAHSINVADLTFKSMGFLVSRAFELNSPEIVTENVTGPVGIYRVVDLVATSGETPFNTEMIDLIALISLSLAIMNILPIPAVDGGRLVFIVYEIIARRKPNPKFEMAVNKYGMLILLALMLAVTYKDIAQLINN